MLKKIVIIGIIFVLLTPIQAVLAIVQPFGKTTKDAPNDENIFTDIVSMINNVDENILRYYLEKFVSFGFKETGSENADLAAKWIKKEFEELGLFTYFDEWKFPKYADKNVIAIKNGTDTSINAVFLISAHYDTRGGAPGAIDDGTGVAAMLTIANITKNYVFNHTLRFVAVSGEEVGTYGSFADAKHAYEKDENIIAVLNIDGIGFDNTSKEGNLVQIFSKERSKWIIEFTKDISKKYKEQFNAIPQHSNHYPADHESYNDFGYDGLMYVQPKTEDANNNPIHTPEDTIDKVNFTYLENMTRLILAVACELAIKPIDVQVRIKTPKEGCFYIKDLSLKLPCYNLFKTRIRAMTYIIGKTTVKIDIMTKEKINSVYFGIDGYLRYIANEPLYEYKIGEDAYPFFRVKGFHRLTVCVTTNTGKVAYDEMDIYIVKLI